MLINRLVGAEIRLVSISTYRRLGPDAILANLAERLREEGRTPYVIPVGGSKYGHLPPDQRFRFANPLTLQRSWQLGLH